jgi:hypothetical protein
VKIIDGQLNVQFCDDPFFTELVVSRASKDTKPYRDVDVWHATGPRIRGVGPFVYGVVPAGMTTKLGPDPLLFRGNYITVSALDPDGGFRGGAQSGVFDGDQISQDHWLTAEGQTQPTACH